MPSETTRDSLLEAAKRVMQRDGAGNLTLDSVAKEAGVSKGGLLYHFPSKQALLRGVVEAGGNHFRRDLEAQMQDMPGAACFARAFLKIAVFGPPSHECKPTSEMIWSLLGATANDPSLLTPIQESQAEWGRRLAAEEIDPTIAQLIRLVGRGMWMSEIFGFEIPSEAERQKLHALIAKIGGLESNGEKEEALEEN